jgi:NADPH:quinone reductase-like Zn-dependent oxidoreductase
MNKHLNEGMPQLVDRVAAAWPAVTDAEFEARTAGTCKSCGSSWRPAKMTAVIDKTFPLSRVPEAIRYLVEGQRGGGKIVHQLYPR